MMNKKLSTGLTVFGSICLTLGILIFACYFAATSADMYIGIHERITTDTGLAPGGVRVADSVLAGYLRGSCSLHYTDEVYGVSQKVFNDREIEHMKDVKALFDQAKSIGLCALIAGVVLCLAAAFTCKEGFLRRLFKSLGLSVAGVGLCLAIAVFAVAGNFSGAFEGMHKLLFNNDLWLLDPATDLMIRLLPEEFFVEISKKIALAAVEVMVTIAVICALGTTLTRKKEVKK